MGALVWMGTNICKQKNHRGAWFELSGNIISCVRACAQGPRNPTPAVPPSIAERVMVQHDLEMWPSAASSCFLRHEQCPVSQQSLILFHVASCGFFLLCLQTFSAACYHFTTRRLTPASDPLSSTAVPKSLTVNADDYVKGEIWEFPLRLYPHATALRSTRCTPGGLRPFHWG